MNDVEFQKLLNAEPPLALTTDRVIWLVVALFLIPIAIHDDSRILGVTVIILILCLFLYPFGNSLVLEGTKFSYRMLGFRTCSYPWQDVSEFRAKKEWFRNDPSAKWQIPRIACNVIKKDNPFDKPSYKLPFLFILPDVLWKMFFRASPDFIMLPNAIGLTSKQLAALMNHWRERALSNNSH